MAAKSKVAHIKRTLVGEIIRAQNMTHAVQALPRWSPQNTINTIHTKHVNQIIELAFMGMVSAWEEFLEASLVRYMTGAQAANGYCPTPKYGRAKDLNHAYEILSHDPDYKRSKDYLKVTEPRGVWRTADFFFSAHPYGALNGKEGLIRHASAIRNRVAHNSEKCKQSFKTTACALLATKQLTSGYQPGTLLTTPIQRAFPASYVARGLSHFDAFAELYEDLAKIIVPD
ncbi:MAG: hypothetical protein LPK20_08030 [Halomonas sp.]|nr:hypothetical protein [Halomonas sp.]